MRHGVCAAPRHDPPADLLPASRRCTSLHWLQVWYCTDRKNQKPWEKPDAASTRSIEDGGHTTWYKEQQLLQVRWQSDALLLQLQPG